jgi:hypothetical protein
MSEHTRVKGRVIYDHMPYQHEGFSFCKRCKKFVDKMEVCFNEGFASEWMQVNCGECGKCIWVCEFGNKTDKDEVGIRTMVKDDQKCAVCKKPTNHYDCVAYGGKISSKKNNYWCSKKCYDKANKQEEKEWKAKKVKKQIQG